MEAPGIISLQEKGLQQIQLQREHQLKMLHKARQFKVMRIHEENMIIGM